MLEAPASPQGSSEQSGSGIAGKNQSNFRGCKSRVLRHSTFAFRRFFQEEEGQAITEYILILSVCLATAIAMGRGIMKVLDKGILKLGAQLELDLKTGRAPLRVWKN
ncbi:MAG: hypothetical protein H7222_06400 [Methylotenera sp.]|nr:hypothetical protein [Oligoflexia bacterium]